MSSNQTHAEKLQAEANRDPSVDLTYRKATGYRDGLRVLLADTSVTEASAFANRVREIGLDLSEDFSGKSLNDMRQTARDTLGELESSAPLAPYEPRGVTDVASVSEVANEDLVPNVFRDQYDRLPDTVKEKLDWDTLVARLLEDDGKKLKQAEAMPRGAELFGVDAEGKALFRNKGAEPVMFAFGQDGEMIMIPDRNSDEFHTIKPLAENKMGKARWAAYADVRPWAHGHGYEFMPFDSEDEYNFSDEMKQVTDNTDQEFLVASADEKEWRCVWLESGDKPDLVLHADFDPGDRGVGVDGDRPDFATGNLGAALLLRV